MVCTYNVIVKVVCEHRKSETPLILTTTNTSHYYYVLLVSDTEYAHMVCTADIHIWYVHLTCYYSM